MTKPVSSEAAAKEQAREDAEALAKCEADAVKALKEAEAAA